MGFFAAGIYRHFVCDIGRPAKVAFLAGGSARIDAPENTEMGKLSLGRLLYGFAKCTDLR
jgi:hypothetical protein